MKPRNTRKSTIYVSHSGTCAKAAGSYADIILYGDCGAVDDRSGFGGGFFVRTSGESLADGSGKACRWSKEYVDYSEGT